MITQEQWAYVAGLVDGEGSFALTRSKNSYSLHVMIYTTSQVLYDWLNNTFVFGRNYQPKRAKPGRNHKPQLCWSVPTASQKLFLEHVLPYLVIKPAQGKLALEFLELMSTSGFNNKVSNKDKRLTPEQLTTRQTFKERLSELNKRGLN